MQKDVGLSALSSQASFSIKSSKKTVSKKIVSVMAPQQSERKPSMTGSVGSFCFLFGVIYFR